MAVSAAAPLWPLIQRLTPYLNAGISLRRITGGEQTGENCTQLPTIECAPFRRAELPELENPTTAGLVIGGGIEFGLDLLSFAPEMRYTRWLSRPFTAPMATENQVELLIRVAVNISK